jgi:hypothetical protein
METLLVELIKSRVNSFLLYWVCYLYISKWLNYENANWNYPKRNGFHR